MRPTAYCPAAVPAGCSTRYSGSIFVLRALSSTTPGAVAQPACSATAETVHATGMRLSSILLSLWHVDSCCRRSCSAAPDHRRQQDPVDLDHRRLHQHQQQRGEDAEDQPE